MPHGWDDQRFFAIGPRHLEAVVTKTCQVLVEGTYNGILEPDRHYIPFSVGGDGLDEALDRLSDLATVRRLTETAHQELCLSGHYSYRAFARQVEEALVEHPRSRRAASRLAGPAVALAAQRDVIAALAPRRVWRRSPMLRALTRSARQPRLYVRLARIVTSDTRHSAQLSAIVRCYRSDAISRREVSWTSLQADLLRLVAVLRARGFFRGVCAALAFSIV